MIMKKALLITRHAVPNYGSLLQTVATTELFKTCGVEMVVLDYVPEMEKPENLYIPMMQKYKHNKIKRMLYAILRKPDFQHMGNSFRRYEHDMLSLTQEYNSLESLENQAFDEYDFFVTGSDQVWGPIALSEYDPAFFWSFLSTEKKRIGYSASFGRIDFGKETRLKMSEFLKKYIAITVRENSAVELLTGMGIGNVQQVLDPVLMLTKNEWQKYMGDKTVVQGRYILVYQVHDNPKMNQYAKKIAKVLNLKLVRVSNSYIHIIRGGEFCYLPSPADFLRLFADAQFVLTNSFHATVFSLIFNKPFAVVDSGTTNTRIDSLLKLVHQERRQIKDFNDFSQTSEAIDFDEVNKLLSAYREHSLAVVKDIVNKI